MSMVYKDNVSLLKVFHNENIGAWYPIYDTTDGSIYSNELGNIVISNNRAIIKLMPLKLLTNELLLKFIVKASEHNVSNFTNFVDIKNTYMSEDNEMKFIIANDQCNLVEVKTLCLSNYNNQFIINNKIGINEIYVIGDPEYTGTVCFDNKQQCGILIHNTKSYRKYIIN